VQPGYCRRHGLPADECSGCLSECRAALTTAEVENARLRTIEMRAKPLVAGDVRKALDYYQQGLLDQLGDALASRPAEEEAVGA
jgi:hypothetical protein